MRCDELPASGKIVAYEKRVDLDWPGDGGHDLSTWMDERNVAMMMITEADCTRAPRRAAALYTCALSRCAWQKS